MAQLPYRGNLAAKVFPFLSTQFGPSTILTGQDQTTYAMNAKGESSLADTGVPQNYYCHNVMPTGFGYKSVGYKKAVNSIPVIGTDFVGIIPVRDPNMTRGWIGFTSTGKVYIFKAGDVSWFNISYLVSGWTGGNVSVAYVNGFTYINFSGFNVYKVSITTRTIAPAILAGITASGILAITSSSNYLILTDGVKIYWSSTIDPQDFIPSQITGAGSGNPTDLEGLIVSLVPLNNGYAVYSAVNVVIASYSQNAKFPWIFRGANNSKGIVNTDHVTSGESGNNYAWTSAGLQKITATGAVTIMPEVSDFLAGKEFEDFNTTINTLQSIILTVPMKVKLAFTGARYLVVSYGINSLTHAVIYDTALSRWGKLKVEHTYCFDVTLNTDSGTNSNAASMGKTLGLLRSNGEVTICNFDAGVIAPDSVIILGKFQVSRSRLTTLQEIELECVSDSLNEFTLLIENSLDGKNIVSPLTIPYLNYSATNLRKYTSRVTGINQSLLIKGTFSLNAFQLHFTLNGRR